MVNSLIKSFKILEAIKELNNNAKLKDISIAVNQKAPTVHNILKTFIEIGYVTKEMEKYSISKKIIDMFLPLFSKDILLKIASPIMDRLSQQVNENVVLATVRDEKRFVLKEVVASQTIIINPNKIPVNSFYPTSTGRILLAFLPKEEQIRIIKRDGLPKLKWNNSDSLDSLMKTLDDIKLSKVAEFISEDKMIHSFAVPLFDLDDNIVGALGTYYPGLRIEKRDKSKLILAIQDAAKDINEKYLI